MNSQHKRQDPLGGTTDGDGVLAGSGTIGEADSENGVEGSGTMDLGADNCATARGSWEVDDEGLKTGAFQREMMLSAASGLG